jgi:hypothetical protein
MPGFPKRPAYLEKLHGPEHLAKRRQSDPLPSASSERPWARLSDMTAWTNFFPLIRQTRKLTQLSQTACIA